MTEHRDDATLARTVIHELTLLGVRVPAPAYGLLQRHFAAARADERRAVVAWLRSAGHPPDEALADLIERGLHLEAGS